MSETKTKPKTQRTKWEQLDRVNLIVGVGIFSLLLALAAVYMSWAAAVGALVIVFKIWYSPLKLLAIREELRIISIINAETMVDDARRDKIVRRWEKMIRSPYSWSTAKDFREGTLEYEMLDAKDKKWKAPIWNCTKKIKALHDREKGIPADYPLQAKLFVMFDQMIKEMQRQKEITEAVEDDSSQFLDEIESIITGEKPV